MGGLVSRIVPLQILSHRCAVLTDDLPVHPQRHSRVARRQLSFNFPLRVTACILLSATCIAAAATAAPTCCLSGRIQPSSLPIGRRRWRVGPSGSGAVRQVARHAWLQALPHAHGTVQYLRNESRLLRVVVVLVLLLLWLLMLPKRLLLRLPGLLWVKRSRIDRLPVHRLLSKLLLVLYSGRRGNRLRAPLLLHSCIVLVQN